MRKALGKSSLWAVGLSALLLVGCDDNLGISDSTLESGVDVSLLSSEIAPGDDFFAYANQNWLEQTEIPGDMGAYGSFHILSEESEANQLQILQELARGSYAAGSLEQKLSDYFTSYMDEEAINRAGADPIMPVLADIDSIGSHDELYGMFAKLARLGVSGPMSANVSADHEDSTKYLLYISQSGLTLPNRDYYLKEGERYDSIRAELPGHVVEMLGFSGRRLNAAEGAAVYELERRIAEIQWAIADSQNIEKTANKYGVDELSEYASDINWAGFLREVGAPDVMAVNLGENTYFSQLGQVVTEIPLETWKYYLAFRAMKAAAGNLSSEISEASFAFSGQLVLGLESLPPRWKRGVRTVNAALGEALGQIYVERHFPPEAKTRMAGLVEGLMQAMYGGIDDLGWMGAETKHAAKDKLSKFTPYIGYPDQWRDYSSLKVEGGDHMGNFWRAMAFEYDRNLAKLGKPFDPTEWGMYPQQVNAYYSPPANKIVFPAAILQPPFFNLAADDAVNYGAIGGVIGHEISHGFDNHGRQFDGDGNMRDWWTEADNEAFMERANALIAQYDAFVPLEGLNVNGELTLGENIGDLSGLTIAYAAYKASLEGEEDEVIDGLTGDQRFFIGWAQAWRVKMRDDVMRMIVLSDEHSPARFRVNGPLANMPEFYEAFDIGPDAAMYLPPDQRVKIW